MNQGRNNSQELGKSSLSVRQIISRNIYPIEVLLKVYKPLNNPKNIFKLETAVQRPNVHSFNHFNYSRSTGPPQNGQNFNNSYRRQKNGYFNNYNKTTTFGAVETSSSQKDSTVFEGRVAGSFPDRYSWRKGRPVIADNGLVQESADNGQFRPHSNVEGTEVIGGVGGGRGFCARNRITDLEEDMSSIEKILNKKFERESIDSEKFIRNKLVMALEGVESRAPQKSVGEALSGFEINGERGGQLLSDKLVETGCSLSVESANNVIQGDLINNSSNSFYHGDYNSVESRLFKTNIVKGSILNNRLTNMFRAIPNVYGNYGMNNFEDGNEVKKDHPSIGANFHSNYNNSRICGGQSTQSHHGIGLEIRQETDVLDNPIWLYKESGSFAVNGPFSTRQMSSLWKSYTFTHKTLFTMTSKHVWGPINLFYPEVKSTFTYIPDLEVISQRLTDISFQNDNIDKINSEDISSIISEINELQLNADDRISAPKLVSSAVNSEKSISEKASSDSLGSEVSQAQARDSVVEPDNSQLFEFQEVEGGSGEPEPATQHSSKREPGTAPWGGGWLVNDDLREKREVQSFQSILKEEEISSRERLKKEAMARAIEVVNSGDHVSNTPKGWKVVPKEKPGALMVESLLNVKGQYNNQASQAVPPQMACSANPGVNSWKGWGIKAGLGRQADAAVDLFGGVTLGSLGNFSAAQVQKSSNQDGFWEMCNSDYNQQNSARNSGGGNIALNAGSISGPYVGVVDHRAENGFDRVDGMDVSSVGLREKEPVSNPGKPLSQKNKRKKGKRVDSSLLAFGIRSDKPRNLNYDLD